MSQPEPNESSLRGKKWRSSPDPRWARLIRPLLWALVITLLMFGAYEVVERLWLMDVEMETLHRLHMARGIFSTLVVAAVVAWMILKASPDILAASPVEEEGLRLPRVSAEERTKIYARWFIAMRWIAVLVAGLLVVVTVKITRWLPAEVWWPLVLTVAALAVVNVLYALLIRWEHGVPIVLIAQGYVDLVILTVLLQFSGGVENALSMMMVFHVIIGGILLSRRHCYGIAATGSLLFALLIWAEWAEAVGHYTLELYPHSHFGAELFHPAHHTLYVASSGILHALILLLTAYFVTTLAERLRENERRLETMAERALAGQQLLEQALESSGAGLRVLDRDLRCYWANLRWEEWFGGSPAQAGQAFEPLNGESSPARQTLKDGQIRVTELVPENAGSAASELSQATSHGRVFQITTAPLRDLSGNVHRIVELAQDITQQKQTQAQMLRAGKLAAVGELAGQVAHEVNNPIAIVIAKINLLIADYGNVVPAEAAQELDKIADLTGRVARIAQGLLSYCRPSTALRTALDVREPIRKCLAMIEQPAHNRRVQIEDRLPESVPAIKGNANELEQVFLNLFLNALDAMPHGGRLTVSATASPTAFPQGQGAFDVVVEDTGSGIPAGIRERIFEPFFSTKEEGRGTGLGLSICQGLVRSHGGEVLVETESGRGTRFIVRLPIETAVAEEASYG